MESKKHEKDKQSYIISRASSIRMVSFNMAIIFWKVLIRPFGCSSSMSVGSIVSVSDLEIEKGFP